MQDLRFSQPLIKLRLLSCYATCFDKDKDKEAYLLHLQVPTVQEKCADRYTFNDTRRERVFAALAEMPSVALHCIAKKHWGKRDQYWTWQ